MKIRYVDWGLANWYEDRIELNKNLKKYPKLHNYILLHEKGHKNGSDLIHDLSPNPKMFFPIILFCLKYPKTLIDLSPIWKKNGILYYDLNKLKLYAIGFISLLFSILLLKLIF